MQPRINHNNDCIKCLSLKINGLAKMDKFMVGLDEVAHPWIRAFIDLLVEVHQHSPKDVLYTTKKKQI